MIDRLEISIYNLLGQRILLNMYERAINSIEIKNLNSIITQQGMYILKVKDLDRGSTSIIQLVKK